MKKIIVIFNGRTGNNLLQFFFGKLLSLKSGSEFYTNKKLPEIFNFDYKIHNNDYGSFSLIEERYESSEIDSLRLYLNNEIIDFDIEKIVFHINKSKTQNFIIKGFFQKIDYYINDRDFIKNCFNYEFKKKEKTLGIHIRKDDITNTINDLPDFWFDYMTDNFLDYKKYITTDSPKNPIVKKIISKGFELYENSPENTILEFSNFSDLILSQGSFSWWMGFLSDGVKHVLLPETGWNSNNSPIKLLPKNNNWVYYKIKNNQIIING